MLTRKKAPSRIGTKLIIRGTTLFSAIGRHSHERNVLRRHLLLAYAPQLVIRDAFRNAAPVGNSIHYLNLRMLPAADILSLAENNALLTPSLPLSAF